MRENMNHRRRMERLLAEVREEQQAMENCGHDWNDAIYDPEDIRIPYGQKNVGKGVDIWFEPEGYRDGKKDRWSRECKKCGKIEYTYTQEPVIVGHKPSFR